MNILPHNECIIKKEGDSVYNSIYPVNIKPYSGPKKNSVSSDKDRNAPSGGNGGYSGQNQKEGKKNPDNFYRTKTFTSNADNFQRTSPPSQSPSPVPSKIQDDINISQVLIDFRNTVNAIDVPAELNDELNGYFSLIETQAK